MTTCITTTWLDTYVTQKTNPRLHISSPRATSTCILDNLHTHDGYNQWCSDGRQHHVRPHEEALQQIRKSVVPATWNVCLTAKKQEMTSCVLHTTAWRMYLTMTSRDNNFPPSTWSIWLVARCQDKTVHDPLCNMTKSKHYHNQKDKWLVHHPQGA